MKREIQITKDVRRELINQFGTTRKTLHQALNYLGRSELLEHIRNEALRRGGVVVITAPEEEVLLDMGDKLVQRLCNDVLIEFDKVTGDANIYIKARSYVARTTQSSLRWLLFKSLARLFRNYGTSGWIADYH